MTIVDMLGVAMGCIGMSFDDFCQCTPFEFSCIVTAWRKEQERRETQELTRARYLAYCALKPYAKDLKHPTDLFTLPGEKSKNKQPQLSPEEKLKRRRAAMASRGLKDNYHTEDGQRD